MSAVLACVACVEVMIAMSADSCFVCVNDFGHPKTSVEMRMIASRATMMRGMHDLAGWCQW